MELDRAELFSIFKNSPLLSESTKLIAESESGMTLSEIANRLHKKSPTVHRALRKLRTLSLVDTAKKGRVTTYRIRPTKKNIINRILAQVYYPTRSFVIGELRPSSVDEHVVENGEVKGTIFKHKVDAIFELYPEDMQFERSQVAIDILGKLSYVDVLSLVGKAFDIDASELYGYMIIVIEDGSSYGNFSALERLLDTVRGKLRTPVNAIFIEKKDPIRGIMKAREVLANILRQRLSEKQKTR